MVYAVLIPAYNRPDYLERLIAYTLHETNAAQIVIADDSKRGNKSKNKKMIKDFSEDKITYIEYDPNQFMYEKLYKSIKYVDEKYTLITANDDFLINEGVKKSVEFLESHNEYSCAHGKFFAFERCTSGKINWRPIYSQNRSIPQDSAEERFYELNSNYMQTLYSTYRTSDLEYLLGKASVYTDDLRFGELFLSMASVIMGKIKYLPVRYFARESLTESSGSIVPRLDDYAENDMFSSKYGHYSDGLADIWLSNKRRPSNKSTIKDIIREGTDKYIKTTYGMTFANGSQNNVAHIETSNDSRYSLIDIFETLLNNRLHFLKPLASKIYQTIKSISNYNKEQKADVLKLKMPGSELRRETNIISGYANIAKSSGSIKSHMD